MNKIPKISRIFLLFPVFFCMSCDTTTKTNAEDYHDTLTECISDGDFHSQLYIFPESIEGLEITRFYFSNTTNPFTGSWLLYLGIKWDEENFNNELKRLDQIEAVYPRYNSKKPIIKYEEKSLYLTINRDMRYEYVLYYMDTKEIVYISNQLYPWEETPIEEKTEELVQIYTKIVSNSANNLPTSDDFINFYQEMLLNKEKES